MLTDRSSASTEPARRTEGSSAAMRSHISDQSVLSPEENLDRHSARMLRRRAASGLPATASQPQAFEPPTNFPHVPSILLSNIGSANSLPPQSFYSLSGADAAQEQPVPVAGVPVPIVSPGMLPDSDLKTQMLQVVASNEELTRAVKELQVSVSNHEIQISDLEAHRDYYESNEDQS